MTQMWRPLLVTSGLFLWACGGSAPVAQTIQNAEAPPAADAQPAEESTEAAAEPAPEEAAAPVEPRLAPVAEGDPLDQKFLHNKWKVGAAEVDGKRIEGEALVGSDYYFTMKMGDYGNYYQSNIKYETCTFNTKEYGKILEVVTSVGPDLFHKPWNVLRLTEESLVIKDPETNVTYYMIFDPDANDDY